MSYAKTDDMLNEYFCIVDDVLYQLRKVGNSIKHRQADRPVGVDHTFTSLPSSTIIILPIVADNYVITLSKTMVEGTLSLAPL